MSATKPPIVMPTAENNEVLRAIHDSDAVDPRIDRTMMAVLLRLTPAERLRLAEEAAESLFVTLSRHVASLRDVYRVVRHGRRGRNPSTTDDEARSAAYN